MNPLDCLRHKTIIVTGASNGIGREIVMLLNSLGAHVIAIDRSEEYKFSSKNIEFVKMDLRFKRQIDLFWKGIDDPNGIYGLVNSAGISLVEWVEDISYEDYMNVIKTNLVATFLMSQQFVRYNRRKTDNKGMRYIVNMGSLGSDQAFRGGAAYVSSKGGMKALTRQMARELHRKFCITCVQPETLAGPSKISEYVIDRLVETRGLDNAVKHDCAQVKSHETAKEYFYGVDTPQTCLDIAKLTVFALTNWAIPLSGSCLQCLDGRS
jgi:NAD(P)-dependent dehydrogenase (short-subunit alcohol dehydrogenase family)